MDSLINDLTKEFRREARKWRAIVMNWKDPNGVSWGPFVVSERPGRIASIIPDDSEGKRAVGLEKSGD